MKTTILAYVGHVDVDVDVDLKDFSTEDLREELELRGEAIESHLADIEKADIENLYFLYRSKSDLFDQTIREFFYKTIGRIV